MRNDAIVSSKKIRRRQVFFKAGLATAGIFVLLSSIVAFFYIPKFRIKNISVDGLLVLGKEELQPDISGFLKNKFFGILPYDNIFILPKEKLISFISGEFPPLKKISIDRDFTQGIFVLVEERKPGFLWCREYMEVRPPLEVEPPQFPQAADCAFMDENGFIFQTAPFFAGNIFLKFFDRREESADVGKNMLSGGEFAKLSSFYKKMSDKNFRIASIDLKDGDIYEIFLGEGWYVILNNKNEPEDSFNNLELVLNETVKEKRPQLEYIDLRFGNKVYFKYK